MAEVKWIKITTDMFDNRKIRHLRRLPEGNNIVLLWVMLLTMAGRCNASGMIFLTENIPYTPKMLADELEFEENTVRLGLECLEQLNMICTDNGFFSIAGWEEYQNIDGMEKIREQNRQRKRLQRERQRQALPDVSRDSHGTVTISHATEEDIEREEEKERDIKNKKNTRHKYGEYNNVLLSDEDMDKLKAEFPDWQERIERLSSYIASTGKSYKSHLATIRNWARKDKEQKPKGRKEITPHWCEDDVPDYIQQYRPVFKPKTAAEDESIKAKAEALKNKLGG